MRQVSSHFLERVEQRRARLLEKREQRERLALEHVAGRGSNSNSSSSTMNGSMGSSSSSSSAECSSGEEAESGTGLEGASKVEGKHATAPASFPKASHSVTPAVRYYPLIQFQHLFPDCVEFMSNLFEICV
jgi:hypothetical protein